MAKEAAHGHIRRLWIPLSGEVEEEERVMKEDVRVVWEISEELSIWMEIFWGLEEDPRTRWEEVSEAVLNKIC